MASPTQWTWVWASFKRWWRTGKPSVLHSLGLQQVGHHCVTEQQWKVIFSLDFSTSKWMVQRHLPTWWESLFFLWLRFTGRGSILSHQGFPNGSVVKNPPANAGDSGSIPGWILEKEIATHSSTLAEKIPWTDELVSYSPWSHRRVGHELMTKQLLQSFFYWIEHWFD